MNYNSSSSYNNSVAYDYVEQVTSGGGGGSGGVRYGLGYSTRKKKKYLAKEAQIIEPEESPADPIQKSVISNDVLARWLVQIKQPTEKNKSDERILETSLSEAPILSRQGKWEFWKTPRSQTKRQSVDLVAIAAEALLKQESAKQKIDEDECLALLFIFAECDTQ